MSSKFEILEKIIGDDPETILMAVSVGLGIIIFIILLVWSCTRTCDARVDDSEVFQFFETKTNTSGKR